ncbi:MAG TPA: protease pro-enzyme activation domain-containing protein, partial [Bryobacteraceae bacterium]
MLRFIVIFLFLCGITGNSLFGQVRPRINRPVTRSAYVRLPGSTHPLASPANDRGRAAADLPMERMLLLLDRSPEQQDALDRLLAEQQDPASPRYHQWLSPDEFGQQFGPAQEDLDTIVSWLEGQGFQVANVARGRNVIEFNGTARQVEDAFQTQMHRYQVNGVAHIANSSAVAIPDALAPVVRGVVSLNSFRRRPLHHVLQAADGGPVPQETIASRHMMVPYDFAAIYNVGPLWDSGFDGTGQSIAIVARSNIRSSDTATFRSAFGLPANNTQVVVAGTDPGVVSGDDLEADLDAQWSGAVAKGATVKLVVATSTRISDGVDLAAQYIVNNNLAGVVSMSFGSCESDMGTSGNLFYNTLWSQAAAQGMSVFVSSGDSGSAGCDDPTSSSPATRGFAVNGLASTPYDVAVGGTGFNDTASPSTWWNSSNDSHLASAKGYIPEVVWNESAYVSSGSSANGLWAGSGGVSNVYPTPSWQTGNGVPAVDPGGSGHHRYIPDVSLNGALHDGYQVYNNGRVTTVGGTSASTPAMAGIMAIVNQYTGGRSGNPDLRLYSLASSAPFVFHDVTAGSNGVPCSGGSPNCSSGGPFSTVGSLVGYTATAGFDLATGWGSVDAHALVLNWAQVAAATHLSVAAPASAILGVPFNVTVKALDASGNTAISYTGSVRLTSTDAAAILPANANLPGGTGTFSVTLKSAGNWAVAAIDSGNSSISGTSSTITVSNALADLAISSLTAPTAVVPGAQVNAVVTVMNKGTGASGPFGVEFFFSATPVFSAAALDTGSSCAVQGLTSGASGNCTGAVKVPATLTPGPWYLVAVA